MELKTRLEKKVEAAVVETASVPPSTAKLAAEVAVEKMVSDPVVKNELNQEPWWQSGVGVFGAGGLLWSLGVIITQVSTHGYEFKDYDMAVMVTALGALASFVGVLYRRFVPGLKPMFHWFARRT